MMEVDGKLEKLRNQLDTITSERLEARKEFKKLSKENREKLKDKVEEAFTHFLDSFILIDEYYGETEELPTHDILNHQSQLLSRFMAMKAQKKYIEKARTQNGQLARHLTKTKFDMEDEKDEIQNRLVEELKVCQYNANRLRNEYAKKVVIQRDVLKVIRKKLDIPEDPWGDDVEMPLEAISSENNKVNRRSWLRFSVSRSREKDLGGSAELDGSQGSLRSNSPAASPITTTAIAILQNTNWFTLPKRRRSHHEITSNHMEQVEELRRRRSLDDDWAIPDIPWGTCITMEEADEAAAAEALAPPQLRATQSAPLASMKGAHALVNLNKNTGVSKKTLEVLDDFDMTFAPLDQLMAARDRKSIGHALNEEVM